jgi:predicted O-methyltransferase YrrM
MAEPAHLETAAAGFEAAWTLADTIPGWLRKDQGRALWEAAGRLGSGATVVEIGSHQGRSTVILGLAARSVGATVVAIDPFVDWLGGSSIRDRFQTNIARAGLGETVELVVGYSTKLRLGWTRPIDLLYIDGKHDYWTYTDDLRWSAHLPPSAEILVHDCFSSVGVTLGVLLKMLGTRYTYLDRFGSLARFTLRRPSTTDRLRLLGELPWFTRNVIVKVLLRLRMRPLARLLGHREPVDPY